VPVYNNWYSNPAANALGLIPMPIANSVRKGGHAMCVAGYDWDPDFAGGGYFIVRNSWGVGWASRSPVGPGYGAIPFLYVEKYAWESWTADSGD
jgi:C1A family cysteine protease